MENEGKGFRSFDYPGRGLRYIAAGSAIFLGMLLLGYGLVGCLT